MLAIQTLDRKGHSTLQEVTLIGLTLTFIHRTPVVGLENIRGEFSYGGFKLRAFLKPEGWTWEITHKDTIIVGNGISADKESLLQDVARKVADKSIALVNRAKEAAKETSANIFAEADKSIAQAFVAMGYDPAPFGY